jgi:hypothetical protein
VASDIVFKQVEALTFELGVSKEAPVIDFEELQKNPAGIANLINDAERLRYSGEEAARHPERRFKLDVFGRSDDGQELTVHLVVSPPGQTGPEVKPEVDVRFSLGYFDFPSINNTPFEWGALRDCSAQHGRGKRQGQSGLFPASRAGLKDRMYVEEILSQMNQIKK